MIKDAQWIGHHEDLETVCPVFKKYFLTNGEIECAVLKITVAGVYEAFINDKRIGDYILTPGCTAYKERLQYQTYDITNKINAGGDNELSVLVGTGWYRGKISEKYGDIHNTPCALICELEITYKDGTKQKIVTDSSWTVSHSNILFSDIYDGEIYDANIQSNEKFPVKVLSIKKDTLIPQENECVREQIRIKPVCLFTSPKGEKIIDFGQNLVGYVEVELDAEADDKIEWSYAEILDNDGNFYNDNYRNAKAEIKYTCKQGKQSYKPHFTFCGFRYIRLDKYPYYIDIDKFTAIAIYSDMKRTGYIETANQKLNRLCENVIWSQRGNFVDFPTDCPQRDERMGWTGDVLVFAKAACYNYNTYLFFSKWLADLRAEQFEGGAVPDIVPNFWGKKTSSAGWGDVVCVLPWQMYLMYGNIQILKDNFHAMKKWVDYITNDTLDEYLWTCTDEDKRLWGKHFGDWLALDAPAGSYKGASNDDYIASAFYAHSVELLVKSGKVLNIDVADYEMLHENIVKAFKSRFNKPKTQTECILALHFKLTDNGEDVAEQLNMMIIENDYKLKTGFIGTPYLLHALSDNGYEKTAYSLLLQENCPSWLYEVNHGATTIWEHWDGISDNGFWDASMNSYNHYAYGSVIDWLYEKAAGIKVCEANPGFQKILIEPTPDERIGGLKVKLNTKYGEICSSWKAGNGHFKYDITVPTNAEIKIDGKIYEVEKGTYCF